LAFHVKHTRDFATAFQEAVEAKRPALIHISVDPEAISPTTTLTKLRERSR
jgi:acetolactate synthase-1/2/3 large subunit